MGSFLLSIASPELLSWIGFVVLAIALLGETAVCVIPSRLETLHKELAFAFAVLAAAGYAVERLGDDAIIAALNIRAENAESDLAKIKAFRTIGPEREQAIVDATSAFSGQRYRAAISQAADDGIVFWASLYTTLEKAGWVYSPASAPWVGNPPAGIPIAAIPGIEIRLDPSKKDEVAPAALALGNAIHANGTVITVNLNAQSNPDVTQRDILQIVIGARVPSP